MSDTEKSDTSGAKYEKILKRGIIPESVILFAKRINVNNIRFFVHRLKITEPNDKSELSSLKYIINTMIVSCLNLLKELDVSLKINRQDYNYEYIDIDIDYEYKIVSSFLTKDFDEIDEPKSMADEIMGVIYLNSDVNFILSEKMKIYSTILNKIVDMISHIANTLSILIELFIKNLFVENIKLSVNEIIQTILFVLYEHANGFSVTINNCTLPEYKEINLIDKLKDEEDMQILFLVCDFLEK